MSYQYTLNIPDECEMAFDALCQDPKSVTFGRVLNALRFARRNKGQIEFHKDFTEEYLEIKVKCKESGVRVLVRDFCDQTDPVDFMLKGTAIRHILELEQVRRYGYVPRSTSSVPKKAKRRFSLRKIFKKFFS